MNFTDEMIEQIEGMIEENEGLFLTINAFSNKILELTKENTLLKINKNNIEREILVSQARELGLVQE